MRQRSIVKPCLYCSLCLLHHFGASVAFFIINREYVSNVSEVKTLYEPSLSAYYALWKLKERKGNLLLAAAGASFPNQQAARSDIPIIQSLVYHDDRASWTELDPVGIEIGSQFGPQIMLKCANSKKDLLLRGTQTS